MKDSSPPVTDKKKPPTARNPFELPREFCPIWPKACSETVSVFTDETEHALSPPPARGPQPIPISGAGTLRAQQEQDENTFGEPNRSVLGPRPETQE